MVATNKQMVDLTYLCFVFLNDRSDAWWEMQWAACQGRDNSRERARESCIDSQFSPISVVFKVSNFFLFLHYYWLLREQLFPSLLPFRITILTLTDRQLMGKLAACMRRSNSKMKLMCCIKGGHAAVLEKEGEAQVKKKSGTSSGCVCLSTAVGSSLTEVRSCLYLFIYLLNYLFIYLFCSLDTAFLFLAADSKLAAFHSLKWKHSKTTDTFFIFEGNNRGWT